MRYPASDFGILSPANHNQKGDYSKQDLRNHTGVMGSVRHFVGIVPSLSGTSVSCSYISSPSSQNRLDEYTTERYFEKLAGEWKSETINISSIEEIVLHPAYQRIISMGPCVLPAIFNKLRIEPDFWFWALQAITGQNPVGGDLCGDMVGMTDVWLRWADRNGYV